MEQQDVHAHPNRAHWRYGNEMTSLPLQSRSMWFECNSVQTEPRKVSPAHADGQCAAGTDIETAIEHQHQTAAQRQSQ